MGISLHFHDEDWEGVRGAWARWWAGDLDRPLVSIETLNPEVAASLWNSRRSER